MADEIPALSGARTEIVPKSDLLSWHLAVSVLPVVAFVTFIFLLFGIRCALGLLLIMCAAPAIVLYVANCVALERAILDDEGVTLLPRRGGWPVRRHIRFRWDEIAEVRRASYRQGGEKAHLIVRLSFPVKFWAFHRQRTNVVKIPFGIFTDARFVEALRGRVPAERIHAELPGAELPSLSARYWRLFVSVILVCAVAAAGCCYAFMRGESFLWPVMAGGLALLIGGVAAKLGVLHDKPAAWLVAVFLETFGLLLSSVLRIALFLAGGAALISGCLGAAAGALIGATLLVLHGRRPGAWRYVAATFVFAAAGFWYGWSNYSDLKPVRVGVGVLELRYQWTPRGDAFLMIEGKSWSDGGGPEKISWYSSKAELERRAALPVPASLRAMGEEGALFCASSGTPTAQLWFVPRRADPRLIYTGPITGRGIVSPDRRHALIGLYGTDEIVAWRICDLATGKFDLVNLPAPVNEIQVIELRDDGTVIWLTGSRPLDKNKNEVYGSTSLPESGEFPYPGKLFGIWTWKINSAEPPVEVYAARTQWLEWRRVGKPGRLRVWRISESSSARVEFVAVDYTQSPAVESRIPTAEYDYAPPRNDSSFDGRFEAASAGSQGFAPAFIVETGTGRKLRLPWERAFSTRPIWSPTANKLLVEVTELRPPSGLWRWDRGFKETLQPVSVVYFLDMDRQ